MGAEAAILVPWTPERSDALRSTASGRGSSMLEGMADAVARMVAKRLLAGDYSASSMWVEDVERFEQAAAELVAGRLQ